MASPVQAVPNLFGSQPTFVEIHRPPAFPDRSTQAADARAWRDEQARLAQAKSDCEAQGGSFDGANCTYPPPPPPPVQTYVSYAPVAPQAHASGGLTGSYGYASPYGNCVDLAKSYGKNQPGDPISWSISSRTPWIGAAALFYTNHVAIVVGIWGNGDVELAHANCPGCATRVSAGSLRGFF